MLTCAEALDVHFEHLLVLLHVLGVVVTALAYLLLVFCIILHTN